jgi:hypothetical protein
MPRFSRRWFAWWYAAIAAGYVLLAIANELQGGSKGGVLLRFVIAVGFAALAFIEFRTRGRYGR